jgi:GNAT superfamily N-acetyltransferase
MNQTSFSAQYIFVRGRQLEGTFPGDAKTGIWPITGERVGRGWGYVSEKDWPFDCSVWPPVEPPGLDGISIKKPDCYYQRVRTLEECKSVLVRQDMYVLVSLNISEKWFSAPNGRIPDSTPDDVDVGSHVVLLHGYDDSRQEFSFQNSWGADWGENGHGYISYALFEAKWVEGWHRDLAANPMQDNPKSGVVERKWGIKEHRGGVLHCCEFVDSKVGKVGWTFFVERNKSVEVEELFIMPAFRNRGYATKLMKLIGDYAKQNTASLTLWVPHADVENILVIEKLGRSVHLGLSISPFRWASYVLSDRAEFKPSFALPPYRRLQPPRARYYTPARSSK